MSTVESCENCLLHKQTMADLTHNIVTALVKVDFEVLGEMGESE